MRILIDKSAFSIIQEMSGSLDMSDTWMEGDQYNIYVDDEVMAMLNRVDSDPSNAIRKMYRKHAIRPDW